MNQPFVLKVLGIFILTILMSWAVGVVNLLILELQNRQSEVKQDVAKNSTVPQTMIGPIVVTPYTEKFTEVITENNVKKMVGVRNIRWKFTLPETLVIDGGISRLKR